MASPLNAAGGSLVLDMGMGQRDFAQARLLPFLEEGGWVVRGQELASWRFTEVILREDGSRQAGSLPQDAVAIAGPGFQGVSLHHLLQLSGDRQGHASGNPPLTAESLAQVLAAMELVLRREPGFQFAGPAQILLGQDEAGQTSILFLPPTLFRRAVESLSAQEQARLLGRYENPLLEGAAAVAFSQSVYLYQFLSRSHRTDNQGLHLSGEGLPFPEMDPRRRLEDYRDQNFLPLELAVPGVNPALAAAVSRNLQLGSRKTEAAKAADSKQSPGTRPPEAGSPLLLAEMMAALLAGLEPGKLVEELGQEEKREIEGRREAFCRRQQKRLERRRMARRYSTWIRVAAAVLVAAAVAGGIRLKDRREEYVAYGLTPSQVCRVVYTALEEQNLAMAKAMVSKEGQREEGAKAFLDRLSNFFVANRMRTGMDPTAITVTPRQWRRQPELQRRGEVWIYGIDRFNLWVDNPGIDRFDLKVNDSGIDKSDLRVEDAGTGNSDLRAGGIGEASEEGGSPLLPCYPPKRKDRAEIQSSQAEGAQEGQQLAAVATYHLVYSDGTGTITVESHRDQLTLEFRRGCWQVAAIRQEL